MQILKLLSAIILLLSINLNIYAFERASEEELEQIIQDACQIDDAMRQLEKENSQEAKKLKDEMYEITDRLFLDQASIENYETDADANFAYEIFIIDAIIRRNDYKLQYLIFKSNNNKSFYDEKKFLYMAIENNNEFAVKLLLEAGADPNIKVESFGYLIFYAIYKVIDLGYNNLNIIALLLQYGANVNSVDSLGYTILHKLTDGIFPLFPLSIPEQKKRINIIDILLKYNININIIDKMGFNALHNTILNHNLEIAKKLIDSGIDINAQVFDGIYKGNTPLHFASEIKFKDYEFIKLLINNKADVNLKGSQGKSFLDYAENNLKLKEIFMNNIIENYTNIFSDVASIIYQYENSEISIPGLYKEQINILERDTLMLETFVDLLEENKKNKKPFIVAEVISSKEKINGDNQRFSHFFYAPMIMKYLFSDLKNMSNADIIKHRLLIKGNEFTLPAKKYYLNPLNGLPIENIRYFVFNIKSNYFNYLCSHQDIFGIKSMDYWIKYFSDIQENDF